MIARSRMDGGLSDPAAPMIVSTSFTVGTRRGSRFGRRGRISSRDGSQGTTRCRTSHLQNALRGLSRVACVLNSQVVAVRLPILRQVELIRFKQVATDGPGRIYRTSVAPSYEIIQRGLADGCRLRREPNRNRPFNKSVL